MATFCPAILPSVTAQSTVAPAAQFHSHTTPAAYRPGMGEVRLPSFVGAMSFKAWASVFVLKPPMVTEVLTEIGAA